MSEISSFIQGASAHYNHSCQYCLYDFTELQASKLKYFLKIRNSSADFLHDNRIFTLDECITWFESNHESKYILVKKNKQILGYFRFNLKKNFNLYIGLDLTEEERGKGIGFILYQCLFKHSNLLKTFKRIKLEVLESNKRAFKLYTKLGFKVVSQENNNGIKNFTMILKNSSYNV
jgi:predicted GNAT family N-acyltransferase